MELQKLPFVSIITPVLNAEKNIEKHIKALVNQNYPLDSFEIIYVDNGSTDLTQEIIKKYPTTKLLVNDQLKSPYLARNTGITSAKGKIIALIDVNCLPINDWLINGVNHLILNDADIVGGEITFTYSKDKTIAEQYDSLAFVDMKYSIEKRNAALGGNLFIKKEVFDSIGLFPDYLRSGGDGIWTKKAFDRGFTLSYSPHAKSFYQSRKLLPLLKKCFRVGKGVPFFWLQNRIPKYKYFTRLIRGILPPSYKLIITRIEERGTSDMLRKKISIWFVAWLCNIVLATGKSLSIMKNLKKFLIEN